MFKRPVADRRRGRFASRGGMMALDGLDVIVLGAGIGGLAVARALALRRARVRVLEQAREIAEVGAGIQISPNGARVLEALGLGAEFSEISDESRGVRMRDGLSPDGRELLWMDLSGRGRFAYVHRADLIALLARGAREAGAELLLGRQVERVEPSERGAAVIGAQGRDEAALVIGADGLHSKAREALLGAQTPVFTRQVAWRALIKAAEPIPPEAQLFVGPGRHLVGYPLRGGTLLNIVGCEDSTEWAEEGWQVPGDVDAFRASFAGFPPVVLGWLSQVDVVRRWGLFRHPVAPRWHQGGLVIMGDAAHPTLPYLAQGGVMALEDAWVLTEALCAGVGLEAALPRYEVLRKARSQRIVEAANANAQNYHLHPGLKRFAGHLALRLANRFAPGVLPARYDWLWGHDVTR